MSGLIDQRRHADETLPGTLYRSTHSITFDGSQQFVINFAGFGADTFIIHRNDPASISFWVKYEGPADPGTLLAGLGQVLQSRWFPTPSAAINEGGHRVALFSDGLSGNPAVVRAMHFTLATNLFNAAWAYTTTSFPLDVWTHVLCVWEGVAPYTVATNMHIYWDGVEQTVHTVSDNWSTNAMPSNSFSHLFWGEQYTSWNPLGAMPDNPPLLYYDYEGHLDEIGLWRVALTAPEALALYNGGHARNGAWVTEPTITRPILRWARCGEGRDGTPWVLGFTISWGYYPIAAPTGFANFFVNAGAGRMVLESVDFP